MAERRPELSEAEREARADWWIRTVRDVALVFGGLGLTIYEGVTHGPERPSLYVLYAGMMGLGPVLRFAEGRGKKGG